VKKSLQCVLTLAVALGASCASHMPVAPPPPDIMSPRAGPTAPPAARPLPGFRPAPDQPGYPAAALEGRLTGRVLVEFRIDAGGRATDVAVAKAQADPILQQAAVEIITATRFDVHDRNYDASDPRPFYASVQFCMDNYCGEIRPFPGYERDALIIGGLSSPAARPL